MAAGTGLAIAVVSMLLPQARAAARQDGSVNQDYRAREVFGDERKRGTRS